MKRYREDEKRFSRFILVINTLLFNILAIVLMSRQPSSFKLSIGVLVLGVTIPTTYIAYKWMEPSMKKEEPGDSPG